MPNIFYGQQGEDQILWSLFPKGYRGTYLDVGALDGKLFSNTYSFELAGWKGICVEAHPNYIQILKRNRPNSIVIHAAIAHKDKKSVIFNANSRGSLSSLTTEMKEHFKKFGKFFTGWKQVKVPMKTINTVLRENNFEYIDVMSMDIEGGEPAALMGFNINKYKPKILVIEALNDTKKNAINKYMKNSGYFFAKKIAQNLFFCKKAEHIPIIKRAKNNGKRIKFKHPLDK
jgi:FkbM family methyltransferase